MTRSRIGVLISGRGSNMAALVYASKRTSCPFEVVLVVSNDPEAEGLRLACAEGIETFAHSHKGVPRAEFDSIIDERLRKSRVEYVALAGYMRLLSPEFIAAWSGRILNIHPSLLPRYKGLDTHARALAAGDTVAGCSVHQVIAELDEGEVIGQIEVAVQPGDTAETLAARVLIAEHQLYAPVLAEFVTRKVSPEWQLQQVRERAMLLPEAEEGVSHGMASFGILKGKKFAYFTHNHHNDGRTALLVKISGLDEQIMLIDADSERYFRPAYFGDGWIGIRLDQGDTDWDGISEWLRKSWLAIAPQKLLKGFMAAEDF